MRKRRRGFVIFVGRRVSELWAVLIKSESTEENKIYARFKNGEGDVAKFMTRQLAESWVKNGEDIDESLFDLEYVELTD
jgi:hypothetical protein